MEGDSEQWATFPTVRERVDKQDMARALEGSTTAGGGGGFPQGNNQFQYGYLQQGFMGGGECKSRASMALVSKVIKGVPFGRITGERLERAHWWRWRSATL